MPIAKLTSEFLCSLHFIESHWTPKAISGRILIDPSNGNPESILNTDEVKAIGIARYGKCNGLMINQIFMKWINYCIAKKIRLIDCMLWKEDIDGAFPQIFINPSDVHLMATRIDEDYIYIYLNANMGYTNTPMAWCCVSEAVNRKIDSVIEGVSTVYVDDFKGISEDKYAFSDHEIAKSIIKACINNDSLSSEKSCSPSKKAEIIGWNIDLMNGTFGPNEKGRNKLLLCFFYVDYNRPLTCKVYQLLASLAERYSSGLCSLSAFVHPFHSMTGIGEHVRRPSASIKFCIDMWRIVALLLYADESFLNKTIISTTGHCEVDNLYVSTCISVISDAGPNQVGAAILDKNTGMFLCYTKFKFSFDDINNKFQNIREYLGQLISCILVYTYFKGKDISYNNIEWTNDSTTAVSWARTNKCSSAQGHFANIIMSWFQIYSSFTVTQVMRIPGKDMGFIDDMSRNNYHPLMDTTPYVDISSKTITSLINLCNPFEKRNQEENMDAFFIVHSLLSKI